MIPKYGYCQGCRELFRREKPQSGGPYLSFCPNKYHPMIWSRILQPCYEIWSLRRWASPPPRKLLAYRCTTCDNRFVCLTNGVADV